MKYNIIKENDNYYFINKNNERIIVDTEIMSLLESQEAKINKLTNFARNCLSELEAVL